MAERERPETVADKALDAAQGGTPMDALLVINRLERGARTESVRDDTDIAHVVR